MTQEVFADADPVVVDGETQSGHITDFPADHGGESDLAALPGKLDGI